MKTQQSKAAGVFALRAVSSLALLAAAAAALVSLPADRVVSATPDPCTPPGVTVVTDATGDELPPGGAAQDIQSISVAEPAFPGGVSELEFTLKVASLSGTLPANTQWKIYFDAPDSNTYWIDMQTDGNSAVSFRYGTSANNLDTDVGALEDGGYSQDGTIIMIVANSHVGNPTAGQKLNNILAVAYTLIKGPVGPGFLNDIDDTSSGSYTLVGNASCATSSPTPTPTPTAAPSATPIGTPPPAAGVPRFFTYMSPQGIADDSGEPSIGSNWTREATNHNHNVNGSTNDILNGGTSLYFGGFSPAMSKVTWDDCSSPAGATWEPKLLLSANTPRGFGDPILFTDHDTGRTFCGQLEGLTPAGCTIDITDDDGDTFIPSDGVIPSDVDHETIGGGPYHSPLPNPNPVYKNAIYYGSQSIYDARTLRSDNGGLAFAQTSSPMYTNAQCSGLHGHVKVAPDGTVYIPNKGCGGDPTAFQGVPPANFHLDGHQAVVFSEDNGVTWNISEVPDSAVLSEWDPSVALASDGTIYFGYQDKSGHAKIAVGHHDSPGHISWDASKDAGAQVFVENTAFPAVVAGDGDRAAFAFIGTTQADGAGEDHSGGSNSDPAAFTGSWYLYIATTYDKGQTWYTQNVTPNDPVQRGPICGGSDCRNLLDFIDATIDKEGRVVVGYDDGCISAGCIAGDKNNDHKIDGNDNDFTAKGAIARQSGGKRMFAANDPAEPLVPAAPKAEGTTNASGTAATLTWPTPDSGGSPILAYNIYRSTGGAFSVIATVPVTTYTDTGFTAGAVYHVTAVNAIGEGPYCPEVTPQFVAIPTACSTPGILAVNDLNADGSDNDSGANTPPDPRVNVRQLYIAEPDFGKDQNGKVVEKLVFTMNLGASTSGSAPPSSQWYIVWNRLGTDSTDANDASFDRLWVGMKSDAQGNLSFEYGKFGVPLNTGIPPYPQDPNANTPIKYGDADNGTYDVASGTVVITLSNEKLRAIDGGNSKYIAASTLSALNVRTFLARPDAGQKSQNNANDITADSTYTLAGNAACIVNKLPTASLEAFPTQGLAPLTVNFDASGSRDLDGTIASYSFRFGDGSADVTQTEAAISHTYSKAGTYFALLTVKDNSGAVSANVASADITVQEAPTVSIVAPAAQKEGDSGTTAFVFTVTVSPAGTQTITVDYASQDGTAKSSGGEPGNPDYTAVYGTLTFQPGETSKTITVNVNGDTAIEPDETFDIVLAPPTNAKLGLSRATATITNDDYAAPSATPTPTASPSTTVTPTPTPSATATPTPSATPSPTPVDVELVNISGRVVAQGGDNVGIGGFIVTGSGTKRVLARGLGPSLKVNGTPVNGRMQDPVLELHDSNGAVVTNDSWRSDQEQEIQQTGLAPTDDREAAILSTLTAGNYTAVLRSADGTSGIGLIELYDLSSGSPGELGNLSVRANVETGDNVLIDGVILSGGNPKHVLFRALGPELHDRGVTGEMQDPTLELHDANGTLVRSNDNWKDAPNSGDIQASGLAPTDDREAAVMMFLPSGNYTSVVRGANNSTGVALNEIYRLSN